MIRITLPLIAFLCCLTSLTPLAGQEAAGGWPPPLPESVRISGKSLLELRRQTDLPLSNLPLAASGYLSKATAGPPSLEQVFLPSYAWPQYPGNTPLVYSFRDLAFFCRLEVRMEKAVGFPVKFRLGDVQYVEQLEGKGTVTNYGLW